MRSNHCLRTCSLLLTLLVSACSSLPRNTVTVYLRNNDFNGFTEDVGYCQKLFKHFDDGYFDLDWRLIAEFGGVPHYQSQWTTICLGRRGWRPVLQFANHRFKNDRELFADILACGKTNDPFQYRLFASELGGLALYNTFRYMRDELHDGMLTRTKFLGCLAQKGWEVKTAPPWYSFANDDRDRILLNFPLAPVSTNIADKFQPRDDGVWDSGTGVNWLTDRGPVTGWYTWEKTNSLIAELNRDNYLDCGSWRLPRRDEIEAFLNYARWNGSDNIRELLSHKGFYDLPEGVYWTSTPAGADAVWGFSMESGGFIKMGTNAPFTGVIMPVHGGWPSAAQPVSMPPAGVTPVALGGQRPAS